MAQIGCFQKVLLGQSGSAPLSRLRCFLVSLTRSLDVSVLLFRSLLFSRFFAFDGASFDRRLSIGPIGGVCLLSRGYFAPFDRAILPSRLLPIGLVCLRYQMYLWLCFVRSLYCVLRLIRFFLCRLTDPMATRYSN